ncbi:MAG TPA: prolyl oligopeptidase family serine peptidase [Herpetosiphonaceae bacterium]|nr:prolyl oligopeptidase family serine peptidase [Herpetosiphonaceae bacterium]
MPQTTLNGIPVLWEEPADGAARRLVIWVPGYTADKAAMRPYLADLAAAGYLALSLDPVDHGERSRYDQADSDDLPPGNFHDQATGKRFRHFWSILANTAADIPAVIDWAQRELSARGEVGIGGISMGGSIALVAAGLDRRIAAVATGLAEGDWLRPGSSIPLSAPSAAIQACYDRSDPLTNPDRYAHRPALLLQCGADDEMNPPGGAERFAQALAPAYAGCPERLELRLEARVGHEFTPAMWRRALGWFATFL